jgi:hypothetical protein
LRVMPLAPSTRLDRYLQKRRIREARRELPPGARVLDIGTHDGALFCATRALVAPNGRLIITVPAPEVDTILHVLMRLNLVAGLATHQHHRFQPNTLDHIFTAPLWQHAKHRTFQLGLNHLFVFERSPDPQARPGNRTASVRQPERR